MAVATSCCYFKSISQNRAQYIGVIGEHLLQTTRGDRSFSEVFKFNQRVAMNVTNLVVKCYSGESVNFPAADVGVFVTPETALAKQKQFKNSSLAETDSQQPAADREIRQRAIAILEKLPESVLDEAVKFLESLYVKGDRLQ